MAAQDRDLLGSLSACIDTRWSAADADLGRKYAAELVALAPPLIQSVPVSS
jgi:hypothetical protein